MAISTIFNGNIEISKLLKLMGRGQTILLEIADGYSINDAMKAITASSPVRKKTRGKFDKPVLQIDVKLEGMTAISGAANDKLSKVIKVTKVNEYLL